ncbi:hydroxyacid dehydrogenase [Propionibacteriaceae bacterium Y2011]|uniref:hydroxyacid dehydrogenase n=1 Tax=Microlunatus sp. Y2014 TaxID=3418488 RepID=UPI003B4C708A
MKIAVLVDPAKLSAVFAEQSLADLATLGEVTISDGDHLAAARGAEVVITSWGSPKLEGELLAATDAKLLIHAAGSVKPVVSDELWARGARVTSCTKPLGQGVAETALGLTIAGVKNFFEVSRVVADGGWKEGYDRIRELSDLRVGAIGAGWAGRHYLSLMQAFDVELVTHDPFLSAERAAELGARKVELDELLSTCDVVSIHAPSIPETRHMINAETLALMKRDAVLINTARGSIIDEAALAAHVSGGGLRWAFLDTFDPEPPAVDSPLRSLPNVVCLPHLAGLTNNGKLRIGKHSVAELRRFLAGEPMECETTQEALARTA